MGAIISQKVRKWQKRENNAVQTKTGPGFDEVLRLNARPVVGGRYRIQWQGEARLQAGSTSQPKFRIKRDGVTIAIRTMSPNTEWDGRAGWDFSSFNEGDTPLITIEIQRFGGADTVEVRRLKASIELMEV